MTKPPLSSPGLLPPAESVKMESIKKLNTFNFPRAPIRTFLRSYFIQLITFIALEKCEKECTMLEVILVKGFCPLKIKISQFLNGFCLKVNKKQF